MENCNGQAESLDRYKQATKDISEDPYNAAHYLKRAQIYQQLVYPDLAAADAYKALLLVDEISDESGEYHEQAAIAFEATGLQLTDLRKSIYEVLVQSLLDCKCFKSSFTFAKQWERISDASNVVHPNSLDVMEKYREVSGIELGSGNDLPDRTIVRREIYPWNDQEPDRNSDDFVSSLNEQLKDVAPKCEVRVAELPILDGTNRTMRQLGLFAKEEISPGEAVLHESSLLTANNNLHDTLCDGCSAELPPIEKGVQLLTCPDCDDIVFCSQKCLEDAMESYHPAICSKDIDAIARDTDPKEASDALYFLLLARTIAMAETQETHPLRLKEISSLWGDFIPVPKDPSLAKPCLPFSFQYNVLYPIHLLTQMDLDIYATTPQYDFWIINTLYAKYRGVASGRPNVRTGKPEVCAVHPLWSLANHSCAPNVTWEWASDITLSARAGNQVVRWGVDKADAREWNGGIKAGQEIWNHYCDVDLDVKQRREWASGPLGGDCMCERCIWEEKTGSSGVQYQKGGID